MKIYTYFEDINHFGQEKLLELWKESWQRQGFEAIVLGEKDAKKTEEYHQFLKQMKFIFQKTTGKKLSNYGLSCFTRWLAYSTVQDKEERFFVSDYDIINSGRWKVDQPISKKLHFLDADCPCMASGTAEQFKKISEAFFEVTMNRIEHLIKIVDHYHDQEFFKFNFMEHFNSEAKQLWKKYNAKFSRNPKRDVDLLRPKEFQTCRAFHISHYCVATIMEQEPEKYKNKKLDEARVEIIENKFLK